MENKFVSHLIDIGFIDKKTSFQILNIYKLNKDINENKNEFNKIMTEILLSYFFNLSEIQKKFICFHLPAKFIKISKLKLKNKLKNILRKKELTTRIILMKYFFKWYKYKSKSNLNNMNNNKYNSIDINLDDKNIFKKSFFKSNKANLFKKKINYRKNDNIHNTIKDFIQNINNLSSSNLITNEETKENDLRKNMDIYNKKAAKQKFIYIQNDISDYVNNLNNEHKIKNDFLIDKKNENILKQNFINNNSISKLIQNYNFMKQKYKNRNIDYNNYFLDSHQSNENHLSTNLKSLSKFSKNNDYNNKPNILNIKTCTNNTNISNSITFNRPMSAKNSNTKKTTYINLRNNNNNIYDLIYCNNYDNLNNYNTDYDLFTSKTPFCKREIKTIESNRNQNYSPCHRLFELGIKKIKNKKITENSSPNPLDNQSKRPNSVNYKYINSLYQNKNKNINLEKVKNKVEKEEGLTFKPELYKNKYINRINSNFMERNYSSPNDRQKAYSYNEKKNSNYTRKNKKMNKKEKEKIINGLITRLYKNKDIKDNEDSTFCNKYIIKGLTTSNYLKGYKKKI